MGIEKVSFRMSGKPLITVRHDPRPRLTTIEEWNRAKVSRPAKSEVLNCIASRPSILTYREREIIKLRFGLGDGYTYTLEEVGHIFKVTRERIRWLETKAIGKIQRWIDGQAKEKEKMSDLPSILDVRMICPKCSWIGPAGNTEPDVDGDGSLGCPLCLTVVGPVEQK